MAKVQVEFINTCSCCDEHGRTLQNIAARHAGEVDVRIYYAGKDFDYVRKYGPVTRGTLIIDGKKRFDTLTRDIIEKAISDALNGSV